ncbi:hypothetical protein MSS2_04675 [Mycobacterium marinum]|nr:hypothetical protein MSS2_04675 [Mycobacterium marinum]
MVTPGLSDGTKTAVNATPPSTMNGIRVRKNAANGAPVTADFAPAITQSSPSLTALLVSSRRLDPDTLGSVMASAGAIFPERMSSM